MFKIVDKGEDGVTIAVGDRDPSLPYFVLYGNEVTPGEIDLSQDLPLHSITQSDVDDVALEISASAISALSISVEHSRSPERLRRMVKHYMNLAAEYEAIAQYVETRVLSKFDEVAQTLYGIRFDECEDYMQTVVNRVVDNYYPKENK